MTRARDVANRTVANSSVDTAQLVADAVDNTILDLAGNYAFTGTITGAGEVSVARVSEQVASGHAGASTSGSWQTRALNTEDFDPDNIVTLSSNQFTLGAGKYLCYFDASGFKTARHTAKIYNVTDTADVSDNGLAAYIASGVDANTVSSGTAFINITGSKAFELQHQVSSSKGSNGLGSGGSTSGMIPNTFSSVTIFKVG